ncbi:Uncharacterised protein [Vibrio cholerae]|nr:Uncharacterised protein [Vibrio cholerae]
MISDERNVEHDHHHCQYNSEKSLLWPPTLTIFCRNDCRNQIHRRQA